MSTLIFIVTFVGCAVALVASALALVTRRFRVARMIGGVMLVWVGLYVAALLFVSFTSTPVILDLGQEHCFDEMCFSVKSVTTTPTLGTAPHQITTHGLYYVLAVQLRNAAKRAPQRPDGVMMWITDQQGRIYTDWVNAQEMPGQSPGSPITPAQIWHRRLEPGESMAHLVAFDLPVDVVQPRLVIKEGSGPTPLIIGDENSLLHAKTAFRLMP